MNESTTLSMKLMPAIKLHN